MEIDLWCPILAEKNNLLRTVVAKVYLIQAATTHYRKIDIYLILHI